MLSGGERTRLAVARMLLRPANLLLLDEPTNHLDIDSKDILLDALIAYGGTLVFVSHDRYFVEKLATKIVEVGHGEAIVYPGRYDEFLWSRKSGGATPAGGETPARSGQASAGSRAPHGPARPAARSQKPQPEEARAKAASDREERRRLEAEQRRRKRVADALQARIADLEAKVADGERAIKAIEASMASPGFYEDLSQSQPLIDRHQALMWEVGELMHRWEELQRQAAELEAAESSAG